MPSEKAKLDATQYLAMTCPEVWKEGDKLILARLLDQFAKEAIAEQRKISKAATNLAATKYMDGAVSACLNAKGESDDT